MNHIKMSLYATDQISTTQFNRLMTSINDGYIHKNRKRIKELLVEFEKELIKEEKTPKEMSLIILEIYKMYRDLHKRLNN